MIAILEKKSKTITRIASVRKALQILDFVSRNIDGFEIKEISYGVKINLSTCYHLINTLIDEEYLTKQPSGKYIIGPTIPRLFTAFNRTATPVLEVLNELQKETQETAYLVGVMDNKIIIQSTIESNQLLRVIPLYVGYAENHHARATSKVIIAYWREEEIQRFFADYEFVKLTDKTPLSLEHLMPQLKTIYEQGYCVEEEEFAIGICCVSAPIFGPRGGPIGSFGLNVPKERFLANKQELIEKILTATHKVSVIAGYLR
jgi:DNA-binding IclR family transcriptional regulator